MREEIRKKLEKYGQFHIIKAYNQLSDAQKKSLDAQLEAVDFQLLDVLHAYKESGALPRGRIEPISVLQRRKIAEKREHFRNIGRQALEQGKIGAVLLAGGQGTRLGFDKPKGMFQIGIHKEVYIFQRLIENLLDTVKENGSYLYLAIMTSYKNHEETIKFFEDHKYFGYEKEYVLFFRQNMAPSVDFEGRLLMEDSSTLSLSPNGNGGWFSSMAASGCLEVLQQHGVEWLNVFSVDNVLQRIADSAFVGATIESGCESSAKVVRKVSPDERVGVMCREDGRPSIVEYYELTPEMKDQQDEYGEPAYNFGVILNYMFKISALERILGEKLQVHIVEKKIPHINEAGELVDPEEPNGYKFEELILDMIHMLKDCLPYEVDRSYEFAPVKNKEGEDSIDTARELLMQNGIEI